MEDRYVVAVELSSSKIIGAVGRPLPDGRLDVIAVEQEKCTECVRRGFVQNIEEASLRLSRIIEKLQKRPALAPRKVESVFVGISGRSMRSIPVETQITLPDETMIDEATIDRLRQQARSYPVDSQLEVVDVVIRSFRVDKRETKSPVGMIGSHIEATADLIVCRPELKKNLQRTITGKGNLKIEGFVVTALACPMLILTDEQKRLGCMLVDMGAETTTVTIYRNGALCHYATIPIGSRNITRDIATLNLLEEKAEEIKLSSGNAIAPDQPLSININGMRHSDISNLVVARCEEIVANIIAQIEYAGLRSQDLAGGIVVIGGGAKLKGITDLLAKQSFRTVTRGSLPSYVKVSETKVSASEIVEIVSVLYAASTLTDANCMAVPQRQELPATGEAPDEPQAEEKPKPKKQKGSGRWAQIKESLGKFFNADEDEDDSELD